MLKNYNNPDISDEQTKLIQDRIYLAEKHFGEICTAVGGCARKTASLRDKNDELAKTIHEYALGEKHNLSLSTGLTNLSKAITLLADFQDIEVSRYEKLIMPDLAEYENVCKSIKEDMKNLLAVRDREIVKRKQLDIMKNKTNLINDRRKHSTTESEILKSNVEINKTLKEMEEMILIFEKQKLLDVKTILQNIILIQLKQHTSSIELLSAAYQDLTEIDEEQDLKQFKKQIQQDSNTQGYFISRFRSHSLSSLSSMFQAPAATTSNYQKSRLQTQLSQSSLSLNSPPNTPKIKRKDNKLVVMTTDSIESLKQGTVSDNIDSTDSDDEVLESDKSDDDNDEDSIASRKSPPIKQPKPVYR